MGDDFMETVLQQLIADEGGPLLRLLCATFGRGAASPLGAICQQQQYPSPFGTRSADDAAGLGTLANFGEVVVIPMVVGVSVATILFVSALCWLCGSSLDDQEAARLRSRYPSNINSERQRLQTLAEGREQCHHRPKIDYLATLKIDYRCCRHHPTLENYDMSVRYTPLH
jgi:hypothetical protein